MMTNDIQYKQDKNNHTRRKTNYHREYEFLAGDLQHFSLQLHPHLYLL